MGTTCPKCLDLIKKLKGNALKAQRDYKQALANADGNGSQIEAPQKEFECKTQHWGCKGCDADGTGSAAYLVGHCFKPKHEAQSSVDSYVIIFKYVKSV